MPSPTATEARVKVVDYVTGAAIGYLQRLNPGTYCVTAEVDDKGLTVEFPLKETSTKPRDILKLVVSLSPASFPPTIWHCQS